MDNPRITAKERGLIKGAIRRAFSRSELRQKIMARARIEHSDPSKPRCKKWIRCEVCKQPSPEWSSDVDHIDPLIPIGKTMAEMSMDELVNRTWCPEENLQAICLTCHDAKTKIEREARTIANRAKKPPKPKSKRGKKDASKV